MRECAVASSPGLKPKARGGTAMRKPIDPDITIEELVRELPESVAVLRRFGIVCIQCGEPVWGTLRDAAAEKGVRDLSEVLAALGDARS